MAQRAGDNTATPPTWDPLMTLAVVAAVGLVVWLFVRKRHGPIQLGSALLPPPLVSPWSPLP